MPLSAKLPTGRSCYLLAKKCGGAASHARGLPGIRPDMGCDLGETRHSMLEAQPLIVIQFDGSSLFVFCDQEADAEIVVRTYGI